MSDGSNNNSLLKYISKLESELNKKEKIIIELENQSNDKNKEINTLKTKLQNKDRFFDYLLNQMNNINHLNYKYYIQIFQNINKDIVREIIALKNEIKK